jgi:hypothetical protein
LGKIYDVLTVTLGTQNKWLLRLMGDGTNGVALFALEQFEIVSPSIPAGWMVFWQSNGVFELTTKEFGRPGFWERYYEKDPEAARVFEQEMRRIVEAEP